MLTLTTREAALIALFCGFWLAVALWSSLRGARRAGDARLLGEGSARTDALLAAAPAMFALVAADGALETAPRVAHLLGLADTPRTLSALAGDGTGLSEADLALLSGEVAGASASGESFSLALRPIGSARFLRVEGGPAPPPWRPGAVLLWFFDATASEEKASALRGDVAQRTAALDALSGLIEAAPFPMWHRGPDLSLALVNGAYVAAVEAEDAMAVIDAAVELVEDSEGRSPREHAAAVRESDASAARNVPATIAGERRMMRVVEVPLGEAGVAGYAIDVEDREQARADLARFIRAQRDMLDRLSAGVAQFGRDCTLSFFNQPFARLFSLTADFLADRPEFDRLLDTMRESGNLPEVRHFPEWKEERRRWFNAGIAADEEDWLLPGGKHLRVVAQPLPDGGLLLIFEDRTEQLQLASARDTLLRVRTATFDNLFEAVGVFASDGRLQIWNNRFRELWQYDEDALAQHPRVDAMVPHLAKRLKNAGHASLVRELVRSATVERKQRSGRVALTDGRDFEFAAVPLPDGNALFTMLDITDSRKIEAALRDRNEALEDSDRLKTAFVSNMSYELRTPLTSISGFAEMLAGGYAGALPARATDYVAAITEAVGRLGALIDNVLDLTQSDKGSLLLAEDEVDLVRLCADAADAARAEAERKTIALAVDIDPSVGAITGDPRRLRQAIDNLLANALAYSGEDGRVLLHAAGDDEAAEIVVSDNGPGIAPEDQARVFDRFHRVAPDEGGEAASLGLGLPLAKQFVEAHGGTIALASEPGQGTTVAIRLPRSG